jgi:hypothetical protein
MRLKGLGAVLLLVAGGACSSEAVNPDLPESTEWVTENSPPYPVGELSPEPVVRIGALEGSSEVEFTGLVHVGVLGDGRIVVVDRGPNEVRWFDEDGVFQAQAGGRGEGPGEFLFPVSATLLPGDTLVLYDGRTQRLTAFDASASLVGTRQFQVTSGFGVRLGGTGDGGMMAVEHRMTLAMGRSEYNYARDSLVLLVPSMSTENVDTVATLPGPESVTWVAYDGDEPVATRQMELPLGELALAAPTFGGAAFVRPGDAGLSFYSLEGEMVGHAVRSDLQPVPISEGIKGRFVAKALAEVPEGGPPPGVVEEEVEARFALLAEGQTVPLFDRILSAADGGSVWLRRTVLPGDEALPSHWTVYGVDGGIRAEVQVPPGFRPTYVAADRIAGVETDGLGVEYATVYSFGIR